MTIELGIAYWVILILAVVFSGFGAFQPAWPYARFGNLVLVVLLVIVGIALFGGVHVARN